MPWNPFQFQFTATYLRDEESNAILEVRKGASLEELRFPRKLLPEAIHLGETFTLKLEDTQSASEGELKTLQKLLIELIR